MLSSVHVRWYYCSCRISRIRAPQLALIEFYNGSLHPNLTERILKLIFFDLIIKY